MHKGALRQRILLAIDENDIFQPSRLVPNLPGSFKSTYYIHVEPEHRVNFGACSQIQVFFLHRNLTPTLISHTIPIPGSL